MRTLILGCLVCGGLLAACENSNYGSEHQEETPMFSLFKKKYPTTVNPQLQAQLQRIESFPSTPPASAPSTSTCTKYAVSGKPPQVVLSESRDKLDSSIGFVISDRPDNAVLLMNLAREQPNALIELWQLASAEDLKLTKKIPVQISPDESSWDSRFVKEVLCLPNGRVLAAIGYSTPLSKYGFFLYNIEQQRFSPFFENYETRFSEIFESQRLNEHAAVVLHFSDSKRLAAELNYNYYNRFNLFTRAHPDGLEVLKLGIDIGNVKQWKVIDRKLYVQTHDPRTPNAPREAYWSLDLSKLITD